MTLKRISLSLSIMKYYILSFIMKYYILSLKRKYICMDVEDMTKQ